MKLRASNLETLQEREFDVLIVGGGINGAVTASALTSQGAKVALIDRGDFASQTSQESSNLAWGGIKYLESFEFRLVRKLCKSRNHLLKSYPSIVKEIRFFTVLDKGFRKPRWMLFMGTLLYWAMGNFATKAPRLLSKKSIAKREPAVRAEASVGGVEYSDAYFVDNDCRFVFKFIREALDHGGIVANYVESLGSTREDGVWTTNARDVISGKEIKIRSKALVNCCGPYADNHNSRTSTESSYRHVFSKGVHLLVPRITSVARVLTFFADDGRMFFVIPMGNKTSVGTTDTRVTELPAQVTEEDRDFILDNINKRLCLENPLTRDDIIAERCGVRPLVVSAADAAGSDADWVSLSRKHEMSVDSENSHLTIYGGKLTDCINVGNEATEKLTQMGLHLPYKGFKWYGEPPDEFRDEYFHQAKLMELDKMTSPDSSEPLSTRLWRRYYASAMGLLEDIRRDPKMAEVLIEGTEYIRCELYYAANHEMVTTLDDFLRRRSKISLVEKTETIQKASGLLEACEILFGDEAQEKFDDYFAGLGKVVEHDRLET
ncbi:MAG: glycerol-3-phosphate dehydrogenase/oxidase [Kofleriaceae bacterium]|nr:glycerol-3-phosphate dehydrogenase/oxidase [Kofleriaceae bacterium]